jgi:hypothetical protein
MLASMAVVAVDEGEVEAAALGEKSGECDLRLLFVVLHKRRHSGFLEDLEPAVAEPRRLVGVDHHVARGRVAILEQALAREQGRDAIAKADLDGAGRAFARDPVA